MKTKQERIDEIWEEYRKKEKDEIKVGGKNI